MIRFSFLFFVTALLLTACHSSPKLGPLELVPPCRFTQLDQLLDDTYPFELTIVDSKKQTLHVSYYGFRLYFNGLQSEPGGSEELALLELLKRELSRTYNPSLEKDARFPEIPGAEKFCYDQEALEFALVAVQQRCDNKRDVKRSEVIFPFKWREDEWKKRID